MLSKTGRLLCQLGASSRAIVVLCAIILTHLNPTLANDKDDVTHIAADNGINLVLGDGAAQFPFPLGSYNGLVLDESEDEDSEARLDLVRRAPSDAPALGNNQYKNGSVRAGETQWWYFPKEAMKISEDNRSTKRSSNEYVKRSTTVFVSLTTCSRPSLKETQSRNSSDVPQLEVFVSTSQSLQKPGPGADSGKQTLFVAELGYMNGTVQGEGDVYIGVAAPNSTDNTASYNYQLATSVDNYFHSVVDEKFLFLADSDRNAALLTTDDLSNTDIRPQNGSDWLTMSPPLKIYINNVNDTSILGLERSFCAINQLAQIRSGTAHVETSMTKRALKGTPKEQFYITGLNQSSVYTGIIAMDGNLTQSGNGYIGGGGRVWRSETFSTKTENNCAVIFGLSFCSDVAYAVPSNPNKNSTELRSIYDKYAADLYQNFSYSLDQIQCNTSSENRWSLAVTCDDCAAAYKQWLCAVTIPRCADFSRNETYLQPRNTGSRNSMIDKTISPGPYKEILPCQDICWELVRNCPAKLGFKCPQGQWLNSSYGVFDDGTPDTTCNYFNSPYKRSAAICLRGSVWISLYVLVGAWMSVWVLFTP